MSLRSIIKMKKPEIIHKIYEKDKLVKMHLKVMVKKHGRSGYILLPKELVGKRVEVIYE